MKYLLLFVDMYNKAIEKTKIIDEQGPNIQRNKLIQKSHRTRGIWRSYTSLLWEMMPSECVSALLRWRTPYCPSVNVLFSNLSFNN
jgi:hypothetical protein